MVRRSSPARAAGRTASPAPGNLSPQDVSVRARGNAGRDAEGTPGDGDARSTDENRLQR